MTVSLPDPLSTHDQRWLDTARAVQQHLERTGRFPPYSATSEDGPKLGVWLNNQRLYSRDWSKRSLPAWRRQWMNEHLPGWATLRNRHAEWPDVLDDVVAAIAAAGSLRLPHRTRGARTGIRIDTWVGRQRAELAAGTLSADRAALLDQRIPGWRRSPRSERPAQLDPLALIEAELTSTLDQVWLSRAQALRAFHQRTGTLPRRYDTEGEHGVGHFLNNCWRAARGNEGRALPAARRAWLDEAIPGWDERVVNPLQPVTNTDRRGA